MSLLFALGKPLFALLAGLAFVSVPDARMGAVEAEARVAEQMAELEALEQRLEEAEHEHLLEVRPVPEEAPAEDPPADENP